MARTKNCLKCNKPKSVCNCGRPTVFTPEIIQKLETSFSIGCTDEEACFYAGIAVSTLYNYQKNNPEFIERKEQLKISPNLRTRQTIVDSLKDVSTAKWFAERKMKSEFGNNLDINTNGKLTLNFDSAFTKNDNIKE